MDKKAENKSCLVVKRNNQCWSDLFPCWTRQKQGGVTDPLLISLTSASNPSSTSSAHVQSDSAENKNSTDGDVPSTSGRKWQFNRQLSRNKETSCSRAVQNLMEHQIFVSIQGNQFRRNGMGDFGTFFY